MTPAGPATEVPPTSPPRSRLAGVLRDRRALIGLAWLLVVAAASLLAPVIAPYDPIAQDLSAAGQGPSLEHWLGTDLFGRDILSRLLYGGVNALFGTLLCVFIAVIVGTPAGIAAGYGGKRADAVLNLVFSAIQTLPGIVLLLLAVAIFGNSLAVGMIALGLILSANFFRLARASTRSLRREQFVDAARVSGVGAFWIAARHLLPNITRPLIVQATVTATIGLLLQAGLSFLGQGPPPPAPEWGSMVREASQNMYLYPWMMLPTGLALTLTALAFNMIGDALTDSERHSRGDVAPWTAARRAVRASPTSLPASPSQQPDETSVLRVEGLRVSLAKEAGGADLVRGVTLSARRGRTLAVVGESGSGKTLTSMAIAGLLPPGVEITGGFVRFGDTDLATLDDSALHQIRGTSVAYVFQDPSTALDPAFTVGTQLRTAVRRRRRMSRSRADARARELLELVGIVHSAEVLKQYPFQLSGGMAQRVAIAIAISGEPELLIADEPTTALDVTVQAEVLELLRRLQQELGMTLIIVTHDLGVVADIADDVVVMRDGAVVERGEARSILLGPGEPYTRDLIAASPSSWAFSPSFVQDEQLLTVDRVSVTYPGGFGRKPFTAISDISIEIGVAQTVGLVGESGSGKTTLGRSILGLVPISSGAIAMRGGQIASLSSRGRRRLGRDLQAVFQNPHRSLDPLFTVREVIEEPMRAQGESDARIRHRRAAELIERVGLPVWSLSRPPHDFSGGQRQRIAIARALAMDPKLIVCDEALSALDVSTQVRIADLLSDLQRERGISYLFIGHDLEVVRKICTRIYVMRHGRIVEGGDRDVLGPNATDPYTRRLLLSAPVPDPDEQRRRREQLRRADEDSARGAAS